MTILSILPFFFIFFLYLSLSPSLYFFSPLSYSRRDKCGRRHERSTPRNGDNPNNNGGDSLVDQAMEAIRRTASNASVYKLDFKKVFEEFDTSGDGLLSQEEMVRTCNFIINFISKEMMNITVTSNMIYLFVV